MQSIGRAAPGALTELLRVAPLSPGKVSFAWRAAVGPALQRATLVRLDGRRLVVDAASPEWAREVERAAPLILPRLQRLLGADTVSHLDVRDLAPAQQPKPRRGRTPSAARRTGSGARRT